jgi:hypothetical protein
VAVIKNSSICYSVWDLDYLQHLKINININGVRFGHRNYQIL